MPDPYTAIQVMMMPRDTNQHGTIFGGVILSYIDLAGAIAARREVQLRGGPADGLFVTVAINRVTFKRPVHVGDVVKFQTTLVRLGHTSITFAVDVVAERGAEVIPVTSAEVVYVAVAGAADMVPVPVLGGAADATRVAPPAGRVV